MNSDAHSNLGSLYNKCDDVFVITTIRHCIAQLWKRRLITGDEHFELLQILSRAIDNAVDANDALNKANAILRGDV